MDSPSLPMFVWHSGMPEAQSVEEFIVHLLSGQEEAIYLAHYGHFGPRAGVDYRDGTPGPPTAEWIDLDAEA